MFLSNDPRLDFSRTFDTPAGERVLRQLRRISNYDCLNHDIPRKDPIDPYLLAYAEGGRAMYAYILRLIEEGQKILKGETHGSAPPE